MNSKLFACFDCGECTKGSTNRISDIFHNHMCLQCGTKRENGQKILKAIKRIVSSFSPPPATTLKNANFLLSKYNNDDIYVSVRYCLFSITEYQSELSSPNDN